MHAEPAPSLSASVETGHVYLVDDDPDFRAAVMDLLESAELSCSAFGRTEDLLTLDLDASPACLILDLQLPGVSGMEFQQQLVALDNQIPIIFITAFGDVETCARAMKRGASEFLTKPLSGDRLLMAVHEALAQDSSRTEHRQASRAAALALHYRSQAVALLDGLGEPQHPSQSLQGATCPAGHVTLTWLQQLGQRP